MSNAPDTPVRSPSYPVWPLSEAITAIGKIEAQYRSSKVDREIAAKIIGYSSLSGPANKALAALAQFGLVERAGKGEMRVTQRARAILHPDNEDEKRTELRAAALEPQLFRELQERWPNMMPPEDGVVMYLNRKGFNQSAIRPAAKAYLQTLLFLEEADPNDNHKTPEFSDRDTASVQMVDEGGLNTESQNELAAERGMAVDKTSALPLNKINMNISADVVHINAILDYRGLTILQKKIKSLKTLMAPEEYEGDSDDDEA